MGVLLVVMLEGDGQIVNRRFGVRLGHKGDVVALHGLHEALGHPVALRAADRCSQRPQADCRRKRPGLVGRIARAVIGQPLNFRRRGGLCPAIQGPLHSLSNQTKPN